MELHLVFRLDIGGIYIKLFHLIGFLHSILDQ